MTESYFALLRADQQNFLQAAAMDLGYPANILEKDIWICWVLKTLFSMPNRHAMAFKGGTSLSKIYGLIHRFSEDVDVSIDYRSLDKDSDFIGKSKSQLKKLSERLKITVAEYANKQVIPFLRRELDKLPTGKKHEITIGENPEHIWLNYVSVIQPNNSYVKDSVLIELGGRNITEPNEEHNITPLVNDFIPEIVFPTGNITVLSPQRTFWEKATLIHVECSRDQLRQNAQRLSRHWYDLIKLNASEHGKAALVNQELFHQVIRHKKAFFNTSYANYDACLEGELTLIPSKSGIEQLRQDYQQMITAGMLYPPYPDFNEIIEKIYEIEKAINEKNNSLVEN